MHTISCFLEKNRFLSQSQRRNFRKLSTFCRKARSSYSYRNLIEYIVVKKKTYYCQFFLKNLMSQCFQHIQIYIIAPEGSFVQPRNVGAISLSKFLFFFSVFFSELTLSPLPKSSENESCFCSCCWWVSGEVICLGNKVPCFYLYFESFYVLTNLTK